MMVFMDTTLDQLLVQTEAFHKAAIEHAEGLRPLGDLRTMVAFQAGCLALEHSRAVQILIAHGRLPSAFALFRPQFESLVRGIWLLHAASDNWIQKFGQPLTTDSAKQANEGLGFADMLKELKASPTSPSHIVSQLHEYKEATWKPLNSYTHGGIHPLTRNWTGYPPQLTYAAVRNANAVLALTLQLLSILSGDPRNMEPVHLMHVEFADCFNLLPPRTEQ